MRLQLAIAVLAAGFLAWGSDVRIAPAQEPETAAAPPAPTPAGPIATGPTATEPAKPAAGPAVQASQLDTFLLRDSKGNLVPVLDLPFEEFERLLRIKRGLVTPEPPAYSLDALSMAGAVEGGVAILQLTATIRVRQPGWVRVPLGLGKAVLREPARHEGPGEHLMTTDPAAGYVCWLLGADVRPHVITLQISAGLSQSDGRTRLALSLPHATESSLRLSAPEARLEASLASGEGLVTTRAAGADRSEIAVLGAAGELELAWQKGRQPTAPGPALLESSGEIMVKVEGENRVSSDARLRVRSFSGSLESFRVRLPPGMEWVPGPAINGYTLNLLSGPDSAGGNRSAPQVVEIKLDRPASGAVEIRLLTALASATKDQPLLPARFEVLGAVRQRGTIDFVVEGDWLLQYKEDGSVRRLDIAPDAALSKLAARYEFSRQPSGLELKVAARPSRISVEPVHIVQVEDRQVRLESTLKYRLRGARADGLAFDLAGWTIDRLTPPDLLDMPVGDTAERRQTLPLSPGASLPNELELKIEAHRQVDSAGGEISFPLLRPIADVVTPATVMIVPADNVELAPLPGKISGLSLDPSPVAARIAGRQQPPLVYRDLGADEPAVFAGEMRVRTQWTTAGARATVRIDKEQMQIEQRIDYRIAYERRRSFEILAPRGALLAGPFQVTLGDVPLTPTPLSQEPRPGDASRFQVLAPADQIGLCQLVVNYTVALPKWDRQKPITLALPLVVPADEPHQQLGGQQVEFVTTEAWQIEPDPAGSDEFSRPTPTGGAAHQTFAWSRATPLTRWIISPTQSELPASVVVAKAWIQTFLAGGARQERAVYRIVTNQEQLRLRLPSSPVAGSALAGINGQAAAVTIREPSTALIDLPSNARGRECVVELWYRSVGPDLGMFARESLRPPLLEGASPPRRLYWQLCLPADEHLLAPPANLATELEWSGLSWLGGRQSTLRQDQLESWIGASRQDPLPRGVHEYLFSTLGQSPTLDFTAAGRRPLLVLGAGFALALGLTLLNWRLARRPESLLVVAVVIGALGLSWPDAAVLVGQTATLGLAVALAVGLWLWASSGAGVWSASAPGSVQRPGSEIRSTEAAAVRSQRSSPPQTTATAPAASVVGEPTL